MSASQLNSQPGRGRRILPLLFLLLASSFRLAANEEFDFFEKRIRPLFVEHCYRCHSESSEKLKGGLHLDTRDGWQRGGESGRPVIVPGQAEASLLIAAVRYTNEKLQMPPKQPLSSQQVADLVSWINSGAPDPRTNALAGFRSQLANSSAHWAFQPPRLVPPPPIQHPAWPRTPVDHYVLAKLEQAGLTPAPPADRRTLLRRVTYDLTGLPPSPDEVKAFVDDSSPDAFKKVVERLLNSPQYGQRWGRFWLDVARYSDTKGYVYDREEKQFVHGHVYRDWVIRAFNEDLPYDQFLLLQIAGDQVPTNAVTEGNPGLAALGFLTVGRRFLGVKHDIIDDRIDVLTRGTLGLTVACARCHDHKYDPVSMRDYYGLYGVFNSCSEQTVALTARPDRDSGTNEFWKGLRQREEKLQSTFQKKRNELAARLRAKTPEYLQAVLEVSKLPSEEFYAIMSSDDLNPVVVRQWDTYLFKQQNRPESVFALWLALAQVPAPEFARQAPVVLEQVFARTAAATPGQTLLRAQFKTAPTSMSKVATNYGKIFAEVEKTWRSALASATNGAAKPTALDPERESFRQALYAADSPATVANGAIIDVEWFFDEPVRVELAKLQADIDRWLIKSAGGPEHAVILADRPNPKDARILLRGNPANPGQETPRRFLELFAAAGAAPRPFAHGSGRLELAQAIASRDNPLTARVLVNRVWQHHFGTGLVRTPSDFGLRAEMPSHPELLDWLALNFMDHGWSIKQLHRLLLLSAVYQQASDVEPGHRGPEVDPANRLLWRMQKQRLDFEGMHDSLLAVTGELDPRLGGRPVDLFSTPSNPRRAVYGSVDRQFVPGVLRVFDFANPDLHIPQRSDTTVPQQALFFMNNPFVVERAKRLAGRVKEPRAPEEGVRQLYRFAYQRDPTPNQLAAGVDFVRHALVEPPPGPRKAPSTDWQYGYATFLTDAKRMTNFVPLPHFTGDAWQGGPQWPDGRLGWVQLTAEGGHAGNDPQHAAVRRWVAPGDGAVSVRGTIHHEHEAGDGITARIVSSTAGELGIWHVHNQKAEANLERVSVHRGDTLDFVVDLRNGLNSDMFKWAPVLKMLDPDAVGEPAEWSAKKQFTGPPPPPPEPLSPWEKYAQILLQANEFLFID